MAHGNMFGFHGISLKFCLFQAYEEKPEMA